MKERSHSYWGNWQTNFMLRGSFEVPTTWDPSLPVALSLPLGDAGDYFPHPEALLYIDGTAYAACDRNHQEILLSDIYCSGHSHSLALHGWTGLGYGTGQPSTQLYMRPCEVVQIDQPTRDFISTARVALGSAEVLSESSPARAKILHALNEAFIALDTYEPGSPSFYASTTQAHALLRSALAQAGPPLAVDITATGHAHIDVAWLWTLGQARRKADRTFHTVARLMEQFPDYHFTQSQPQLYDYIRRDHPALFETIKQRVSEGRWEPIGGMWVEADCNLSGSEALARQFLLGRAFFTKYFGAEAESPVLWLPDVFGYSWALPQLIKQAGLEYFFTTKIGWNQYNRHPYESFWWQGIDGTRVLTHFSTTEEPGKKNSTYNALATPSHILGTWLNAQQKDAAQGEAPVPLLMAFSYGDGGGPTREMLENIRELDSFPAMPHVQQNSVKHFFETLEETSGPTLPIWNGELYLEYHRGTYTTQGRNKRANRKSEFLLHDAEFLATLAHLLDLTYAYPASTLHSAWELLCLNQFHDIIPGSSIHEVYTESQEQYATLKELGSQVCEEALEAIARQRDAALLVVNPTSFARHDLAFWPSSLEAGHYLYDPLSSRSKKPRDLDLPISPNTKLSRPQRERCGKLPGA
ncbi:hypothetical protein KSC_071650 [Ktedonobacter sp. SOSP1-52]|nr:hypothetical protein KSC_071650 [Ktedonobacter sp. SOSP1-52]